MEILSVELNEIPGCYGAQQSEDEETDQEDGFFEREFNERWRSRLAHAKADARAELSEQAGVLVRAPDRYTPEQLIEGTVTQWTEQDAKGPVYYLVAGGAFELIVTDEATGAAGVGTIDGGTVTVPAGEIGDTVIVEEIDQCTTQTTVVRSSGGSTTTRPPGGSEEDEDIHLFPGGGIPPSVPPGEEEDDEEEPLYCTIRDNEILTPVTREYLSAENSNEPASSRHSPAIGALGLQLGSGRWLQTETDLHVTSLGHDVVIERTYAGHMETAQGGNLGHRWQLNLDRRITVEAFTEEREGLKVEPLFGDARISYADGYGRLDSYQGASKEVHDVLNFGVKTPFKAHITTFVSPPGAMHEIQRYIAVKPRGEMGLEADPTKHPFANHPNVDTEHGEALFYVLRTPDHDQYVFNCRGQNIAVLDRFGHETTLEYAGAINPLTHNPVLTKIRDASKREYVVKADRSFECAPFLTWFRGGVKSNACAPVPLFTQVIDPWSRTVKFGHSAQSQLESIERNMGGHSATYGFSYAADGDAKHLVRTAWQPVGGRQKPYLVMNYTGGKVSAQIHGGFAYGVKYPSSTKTVVTNPGGTEVSYQLDKKASGTVAAEVARKADGETLTTRFAHNTAGQVVLVRRPLGNEVRFEYYGRGAPVQIPEAPMQNLFDQKTTYRNPLSEGFLKSVTRVSNQPDDDVDSIAETIEYEPLYNQVTSQTDGRGNTTRHTYKYDRPGFYGRPAEIQLSDRTNADGDKESGFTVTFGYDKDGHKIVERDPTGASSSYAYDGNGALVGITNSLGARQAFRRDERGNVVEEVRPSGLVLRYQVDLRDLPTQLIEDPTGARVVSSYAYDANLNRTSASRQVKDLFANVSGVDKASLSNVSEEIEYDVLNRAIRERHVSGNITRTIARTFNAAGGELSFQTEGATVANTYDGFDRLVKTQSGPVINEYGYDDNGNRTYEFDAEGNGTLYGYDGLDRRTLIVDPLDTHFHQRFDAADNLIERRAEGVTGAVDGSRRTLQHIRIKVDEHHKPIEMAESSLNGGYGDVVTRFFYDMSGAVVREQVGRDVVTLTERDSEGQPVRVVDPVGNELLMEYTSDGLVSKLVEVEQEQSWDPLKRSFTTNPKRYTTAFEYNLFGHMVKKTQDMLVTRLCWNSAHDLRCEVNPRTGRKAVRYHAVGKPTFFSLNGSETTLTYNSLGLVERIDSPSGKETREYDEMGRVTKIVGSGSTVTSRYDVLGNPVAVTDGNGLTVQNTFGPTGLLVAAETSTELERFRHDGLGRVVFAGSGATQNITVEREYDGLGLLIADKQGLNGDVQTATSTSSRNRSRTLTFPELAGPAKVTYITDALGRITTIDGPSTIASGSYVYSGTGRLAGRYAGDHVSDLTYDAERRLITKVLYDAVLGEPKRWEGNLFYDKGRLQSTAQTFYPVSSTFGANKRSRHRFHYDDNDRIVRSETQISTREFVTQPWLHQSQVKHNDYARDGSLSRVATSFASVSSEGFFSKEDIRRVSEVRVDSFSRDAAGRVSNTATSVVMPNTQIDLAAVGLDFNDIDYIVGQAASYDNYYLHPNQAYRYDGNGNLIEDSQFTYSYDFRNRVTHIVDKLARQWQREQELFIRYDALGRIVAKEFRLRGISRTAFDRKDMRLLYWQRDLIAELAREPGAGANSAWKSLARYVPGASAGETLLMQRRENDSLAAEFKTYYLYEGLRGDMAFVSEPVGRLKRVLRTPHFTGEDAWTQGMREEPFIAGTTTRMPITGKGQRFDSFSRMTLFEGRPGGVVDYQSAPMLEYQRYSTENYSALIERIQEHHPKPEFLRNLEYGASGAMLLLMAPMLPVAAEGLLLMELEGALAVGVDIGVSAATGNKVTADGLAQSFAFGAIGGGVGRIAGGMSTMASLKGAKKFASGLAVDTTVGVALDVGVAGGDFSKALASNLLSSGISTGLGAGLNAAKRLLPERPTRAPSRVSADQTSVSDAFADPGLPVRPDTVPFSATSIDSQLLDAVNHIGKLAARGMPVAQEFMKDFRSNKFLLMPPSSPSRTMTSRLYKYRRLSNSTGKTVISVDPGLSAEGFHHRVGKNGAVANQVIQLKAGMTPKFTAVTLLHEFSHARGANELQAFHITYDAMQRLRMLSGPHPGVSADLQHNARTYLNEMNAAHSRSARRRVMRHLREDIIFDYMPRFWTSLPLAKFKTSPHGWVSELGARPW